MRGSAWWIGAIGWLMCTSSARQAPAAEPAARQAIVVTDAVAKDGDKRMLSREIVRQAFLIAARHELGARTYDAMLREALPAGLPQATTWNCYADYRAEQNSLFLSIQQRLGGKNQLRHHKQHSVPPGNKIEALVYWCEKESRGLFAEVLKAQLPGAPPAAAKEDTALDVEPEFQTLNFLASFDAVRRLHRDLEIHGESHARLAALARGYANLALLTAHLWNGSAQVLQARALLYAERLYRREPKSARALWHRGYVRAIIGRHNTALDDFAAAKQIAAAEGLAIPPWAALAESFMRYDVAALENPPPGYKPLAAWFYFLAHEGSTASVLMQEISERVIEQSPDAYRAYDLWSRVYIPKNDAIEKAPLALAEHLYAGLEKWPDLPAKAREICTQAQRKETTALGEFSLRPQLTAALRDAGLSSAAAANTDQAAGEFDNGALGWQALANLIDDLSFVQAARALIEQRGPPEVQAVALWHPWRKYLDMFGDDEAVQKCLKELANFDERRFPFASAVLFRPVKNYDADLHRKIDSAIFPRSDPVYRDQSRVLVLASEKFHWQIVTEELGLYAPHMPLTMAGWLQVKPAAWQERLPELLKRYRDSPDFVQAVAENCVRNKDYAAAIPHYRWLTEKYPDTQHFYALAAAYRHCADEAQWLATMKAQINYIGDNHFAVCCVHHVIALQYMEWHRWDDAAPHAQEALSTGAHWGYTDAGAVAEAREDWTTAEECFKAASENYPEWPMDWYAFCRRTGHGDLQSARQFVEQAKFKVDAKRNTGFAMQEVYYEVTDRQFERAFERIQPLAGKTDHPFTHLFAAILADRVENTKERDAYLMRILTTGPLFRWIGSDERPIELVLLAELIFDDLAAGGRGAIDLAAAEQRVASAYPSVRSAFYMLLGEYLEQHGQGEAAIECWKRAMAVSVLNLDYRMIAGARLAERRIAPSEYRKALREPATFAELKRPKPLPPRRPPDAAAFQGRYYRLMPGKEIRWSEAHRNAQLLNGDLVCITSPEEQAFVAKLAAGQKVWLGGYREGKTWKWTSGEPFQYQHWDKNRIGAPKLRMMGDGVWWTENDFTNNIAGYVVEWKE